MFSHASILTEMLMHPADDYDQQQQQPDHGATAYPNI
jgi:hypothetical protein